MPSKQALQRIKNPHDKFFKENFMRKEVAASFFEQYLPPSITEHFDWPSLELEPTCFVDDSLKHQESDLLFNIKLSCHKASLYVLFEHQKKPDRWMPFRLLSYMVGIWHRWLKNHANAKRLPAIIPLVLYQGPQAWKAQEGIVDLIEQPPGMAEALSSYIPYFSYERVDLAQIDKEGIGGHILHQLGLGLMKAVAEGKTRSYLDQVAPLFRELLSNEVNALELLHTYFVYLANVDASLDNEYFQSLLSKIDENQIKTEAMTLVEQWLEQGRTEGRIEGITGQINLMERLLGKQESTAQELSSMSTEQLEQMLRHLEEQLSSHIPVH